MSKTKTAAHSPAQAVETFPADDCANRLKALGDPLRLRVVQLLRYGELTVGDIAQFLETPLAGISHHLQILKHAQLVTTRRAGRHIYYQLHHHIARCASTDEANGKSDAVVKLRAVAKSGTGAKGAVARGAVAKGAVARGAVARGALAEGMVSASINLGCCRLEVPPLGKRTEKTHG